MSLMNSSSIIILGSENTDMAELDLASNNRKRGCLTSHRFLDFLEIGGDIAKRKPKTLNPWLPLIEKDAERISCS